MLSMGGIWQLVTWQAMTSMPAARAVAPSPPGATSPKATRRPLTGCSSFAKVYRHPHESAITRSGAGLANAPLTGSTIEWDTTIRWYTAGGWRALTSEPAGAMTWMGRLQPSLLGMALPVMVRHT